MRARFCLLAASFFFQAFGSNAQEQKQIECVQAALSNHVTGLQALQSKDKENFPFMLSVERTIANRRLQEQYCMQFTQCIFPTEDVGSLNFGIAFGDCLEDEVRDQYELPPKERRSRKPKR
jgi:hypothetical protein